ncbi:hypothetical protein LTR85_008712 [Meristemomyces frigidus]|nr:hypothetical protein LTR85_008712 [Meristemomyces frigidus]
MASIYANAYLTIAATASADFDGGCFRERSPTVKVEVTDIAGQISCLYARERLGHAAFDFGISGALQAARRNAWRAESQIDDYPLFGRGWCFQERLLSPRVLHYTSEEIVWECLGMTSCECGTMDRFVGSAVLRERRNAAGVPLDIEVRCGKLERSQALVKRLGMLERFESLSNFRGKLPAVLSDDYAFMSAIEGKPLEMETTDVQMRERWRDLVSQYSHRHLTYATDTLPALSGLAKSWQARSPGLGQYLAGLWEHDLLRGLLWQCVDRGETARPGDYLAPSWSWASLRGAVDWLPFHYEPIYHVTIMAVATQPSGRNAFGEVTSGHVKLRGLVVIATMKTYDLRENTAEMQAHRDCYLEGTEMGQRFFIDSTEEYAALLGQELHCLWCSTDVNDLRTMIGFERGLVLRRCDNTSNTFRRVGVMANFRIAERDAAEVTEMELIII